MKQVLSEQLWTALSEASHAEGQRYAAVAYVTSEERVAFRTGDMLIVDASNDAIKSRKTSRTLLRALVKRGVVVSSIPGLHAKLIAFPNEAFIGSMNFSKNSPKLTEAAFHTRNRGIIAEVREFVRSYAAAGDEVDEKFLRRIAKLTLAPFKNQHVPPKRIANEPRLWLVSSRPLPQKTIDQEADAARPGEEKAAERVGRGFYPEWIRFGINTRFRVVRDARPGDRLIIISTDADKNVTVWRDNYMISVDTKDDWKRLHYQASSNEHAVTWSGFEKVWKAAGGPVVTPDAMRLIPKDVAKRLRGWLASKY